MSRRRAVALMAAIGAALFILYSMAARAAISWDLTAEGSAHLSDTTIGVLRTLDRRIEITAFFPRDAVGRVEAATLLTRYRKANRRITFRILDPSLAAGEAQRLGVEQTGSAAVQDVRDPKRVEIAQYAIEIDVTSAIARLVRGVDATVCFAAGHGERSIRETAPAGLFEAAKLLRENGYTVRRVQLLARRSVPSRCDALVIAGPTSRVRDIQRAVTRWIKAEGKVFLLADPGSDADLSGLSKRWAIRFVRGVVLEGDDDSHLPNDVTAPIVTRYAGGSPVVRGLGPTFFPGAMGVQGRPSDEPGLTVTELAFTSSLGYLDREDVSEFDPEIDVEGPVALGAAADESRVRDPGGRRARIERTRVLAWGDVDFASNAFISDGSNGRLWVQGIDWLTQPEDLVTAVPNFPKVRELALTEGRSRYMLFLTAGVVPGLFVIAGGLVWAIRRGR